MFLENSNSLFGL